MDRCRIPESYLLSIFSSFLSARFYYINGIEASPFHFFGRSNHQTRTHLLSACLTVSDCVFVVHRFSDFVGAIRTRGWQSLRESYNEDATK